MLERLLELHPDIIAVLLDKETSKASDAALDLSCSQWLLAEELVNVLRPFESAMRIMTSEQNISLSFVVPVMDGLTRGLSVAE